MSFEAGWQAGMYAGMGGALILCGFADDHRGWIAGGVVFVLSAWWQVMVRGGR